MNVFIPISATFSLILGLGVTRLLTSAVAIFRSRRRATMDWIPLTWAGCVFVQQLQFWWGLIELRELVEVWELAYFLSIVCLVLLLFVAAALVLPNTELDEGESLRTSFMQDGRWGLAALSAYNALAIFIDILFWGAGVSLHVLVLLGPMALLPALFLLCRSRRLEALITIVYVALDLVAAWALSPRSY